MPKKMSPVVETRDVLPAGDAVGGMLNARSPVTHYWPTLARVHSMERQVDLTVIMLVVAPWVAVAAVAAAIYGRVVRRADHYREMTALQQEVGAGDVPASPAAALQTWAVPSSPKSA